MGLGSLEAVSLSEARAPAAEARRLTQRGLTPSAPATASGPRTGRGGQTGHLRGRGRAFIKAHKAGWRNAKHCDQWRNTLATYVYPFIGALPVQQIDAGLVLRVLDPIWTAKPETASRVRQRIEVVLDAATARGHRTGENPARWRGHLDSLLPARAKVSGSSITPRCPMPS